MPCIPGNALTRSKRVFPFKAERAEGALIYSTDGRVFIDTLAALGAITLGYRQPPSVGGVFSLSHRLEEEAAQVVLTHVAPWASWTRFVKTGSESTHACYRIARAATGRDEVVRCVGAYHGWYSWSSDTPGTLHEGELPDHDVAAVFVEPYRFKETDRQWLVALREWCDHTGSLLVFDSMIYGPRFHIGGASGRFGIEPDLEAFGKGYANGAACAFLVGTPRTYHCGEIPSGTFSGDISGLAAVIDTLDVLTSGPVIATIYDSGQRLADGLRAYAPSDIAVWDGQPECQRLIFVKPEHKQRFAEAMWARGVLWYPGLHDGDHGVVLLTYAHNETLVDQVLDAALAVFRSW